MSAEVAKKVKEISEMEVKNEKLATSVMLKEEELKLEVQNMKSNQKYLRGKTNGY